MSGPLIIFVTLIYIGVSVEQWARGNKPMCIVYAGYAFANVGLYWAVK